LKITISHPHGNPNSFHAAEAFAEAGWLRSFERGLTGDGLLADVTDKLPGDAGDRLRNRRLASVASEHQRQHVSWETISRLGKKVKPSGFSSQINWNDVLFCGHDLQVSRELRADIDSVYAYEDAACRTFVTAKRMRALAVYELPLGYFAGVAHEIRRAQRDRPHLPVDFKVEPEWKQQRKNSELSLADLVVVPSEWARNSLNFSKLTPAKVIKVPYGTPAGEMAARTRRPEGPFRVLFAGQIGVRKGIPLLLEAWKSLRLKNARLLLAGSIALDESYLKSYQGVQCLGPVRRLNLLEIMKSVDLFVFPSLADGFGLVIGEAMAMGVPVLTTTNTGGPELITNGREGWCVPAHDVAALAERIEWGYMSRDTLWDMGMAARRTAEQWTWSNYRQMLIKEISPYLNNGAY
jgi:alpha-maltose-1-phosphate synthase